jgi:GWxTD domain-containing protein
MTVVMPPAPRLLLCAALLAAAAGPSCLAGQEPADRARLDSMAAAFAPISDSTTLLAMEAARIAVAREHRDDPMLHLELGILAYRIGEVTVGSKHYDDAGSEFEWATDLRPDWPTGWYWLGRAELAIGESRAIVIENIREVLGVDPLSKAARAFARAATADPSYSRALVDLATTALRQRIAPRLDVAQRALRLAAATPAGREPEVLLARGRVELDLDARDSALVAFRAYLAAGGDSGVGGFEIARTLALLQHQDSAVARYSAALRASLSPAARALFRRDIGWIATPEELATFDRLPPDEVGKWLRRFWGERDVANARRSGERLVEQFRRYAYARANFRLTTRHRHYDITDVYRDSTQQEFDDRGVIYLRHGEPDGRARYADQYVEPNESWVYRRPPPDGDLVFHFVATGHVQDYKLVESLLDAYGFSTAVTFQARADAPTALLEGLLTSRAGISDIYQRLAEQGSAGRGRLLAEERRRGRRAVTTGTTTDSYELRFVHDLHPVVSSFVLADSERQPVLHVVFALPAAALRSFPAPGGVGFPFEFRLIVYDSAYRSVGGLDTTRVFRTPTELPAGSYLTEQLAVRVPPGKLHFHFVVEELQANAGALVSAEPVEVPRTDTGFSASDLVLGLKGSGLVLRRDGGDVPLNPLASYPRDAALELYYELYGLPQGATVATRVSVQPEGGRSFFQRLFGGGHGANLDFGTVTDAAGRTRVRQQIVLAGLTPGRYVLTLDLVDDASHQRVTRRQPFEIGKSRAP